MKMSFFNSSVIMIREIGSSNDGAQFRRRDIEIRCGQFVLVLLEFDDVYFIPATAITFVNIHTALAAFIRAGLKQVNGCQAVHAIVRVHDEPAGNCEITKHGDGYCELLHDQGKDNGNSGESKLSFVIF